MLIQEILARRTDLSTFLVHLTRSFDGVSARNRLRSIILADTIEAVNPFGHAVSHLRQAEWNLAKQLCVCFTETPLQHLALLTQEIEGRQIRLSPYGVAITKKQGRRHGVNPVWYLDITPGHDWLTTPLNDLIERAIAEERHGDPVLRLTPFIEQFGKGAGRTKDFSWEREWRIDGPFTLPSRFIIVCPESQHEEFRSFLAQVGKKQSQVSLLDAHWGLEEIIAKLAGFRTDEVGPVMVD